MAPPRGNPGPNQPELPMTHQSWASVGQNTPAGSLQKLSFEVDSRDLDTLHRRLQTVISDITTLETKVATLATTLSNAASAFGRVTGGGGRGGALPAGPSANTTAPVTGGPSGASPGTGPASTTTPAPVTGEMNRGIALAVAGEFGARAVGSISNAMSQFQNGPQLGIDTLSRQMAQIWGLSQGGVNGANQQRGANTVSRMFTGISNVSPGDLQQALGTLRAGGPQIFSAQGMPGTINFLNQLQKINPTLGAQGAAQIASTMAAPQMQWELMQLGGGAGSGLVNWQTGAVNNPQQTYRSLLRLFSRGRITTPQQARAAANDPNSWAMMTMNMQNVLPQAMIQSLQSYAAAGMSFPKAAPGGAVATSQLARTTAGTATGAAGFEATASAQSHINALATAAQHAARAMIEAHPSLVNFGDYVATAGTKASGFASKLVEADGLLKTVLSFAKTVAPLALEAGDPKPGVGDPSPTSGMQPKLSSGVRAMMAANPKLRINSGKRTGAQQAALYALKGGKQVAPPGHSKHQTGNAVDVGPSSQMAWIAANAPKFGLYTPDKSEPWHLESMGDPSPMNSAVSAAQAWIGTPYLYGGQGTQPGQPVDCSRFVQEVYAKVGVNLPRTSQEQATQGTVVNGLKNAIPGDLIFYNYEGPHSHVALYIGNNQQIAAPHTGTTVQVQPVDSGHIDAIRRVTSSKSAATAAQTATQAAGGTSTGGTAVAGTAMPLGLANTFASQVAANWLSGSGVAGPPMAMVSGVKGAAAPSGTSGTGAVGAGTSASVGTGGTGTQKSVVQAVMSLPGMTKDLALAMLTGSALESNQNPNSKGAGSYGAWQLQLSAHPGVTQAQADDPKFAAQFMVGAYKSALAPASLWASNPQLAAEQTAYGAERPAADYYSTQGASRVAAAFALASSEVGDPTTVSALSGPAQSGGIGAGPITTARRSGGVKVTLHMPIQMVGATQADAEKLVRMVVNELQKNDVIASLGTS